MSLSYSVSPVLLCTWRKKKSQLVTRILIFFFYSLTIYGEIKPRRHLVYMNQVSLKIYLIMNLWELIIDLLINCLVDNYVAFKIRQYLYFSAFQSAQYRVAMENYYPGSIYKDNIWFTAVQLANRARKTVKMVSVAAQKILFMLLLHRNHVQ